MNILSGLDHITLITENSEVNRRSSTQTIDHHRNQLTVIGTSLSILFQVGTCHPKCHGGPHVLERLCGRAYNLACSSYILICSGFYDESLNLIRSLAEIANLISMFIADRKLAQQWFAADRKERLRSFSPAKIRKHIGLHEDVLLFADQDWYAKFCEDYTHVHPDTVPNVDYETGKARVGGFLQHQNTGYAVSQLLAVISHIALIACQFSGLDNMSIQLTKEVDLMRKEIEKDSGDEH